MVLPPRRSNLPGSPGISSRSELGLFVHFRGEADSLALAVRLVRFCETEPIPELGLFVQIATPLVVASAAFAALPICSSSGP